MLQAIEDLRHEGIYHYLDTLYYDCYVVWYKVGELNNAVLCLRNARDLARSMVGAGDPRVMTMSEKLLRISTRAQLLRIASE